MKNGLALISYKGRNKDGEPITGSKVILLKGRNKEEDLFNECLETLKENVITDIKIL